MESAALVSTDQDIIDWVWVAGYSSLSTLVIILNLLVFFSIGKNSYLHYSTHYTVLAIAIRNILFVIVCMLVLFLTKLRESHDSQMIFTNHTAIDLTESNSLICNMFSGVDTFLTSILMFYLLGLGGYMFCRSPNPSFAFASQTALKMYGLNSKAIPIKESVWHAPLMILIPLFCAILLSLPAPLLQLSHPMTVIPGRGICLDPANINYQTSIATLSYCLPILTLVILIIALGIRRCLSCTGGECISSFCKEEIFLGMITLPYALINVAKLLPLVNTHLTRIGMPGLQGMEYLDPAIVRAVEGGCGVIFPVLLYCLLPAYRNFSSEPDSNDLYQSKRDIYRASNTATQSVSGISTGGRLSQASDVI